MNNGLKNRHGMKLYVINLERSPERLSRMQTLFAQQGLTLSRITAIDAQSIADNEFERLTTGKTWPEPLTRGEVACFLSHRLALHHIAQGAEAYGAVFEDDITLSPQARFFLGDASWIAPGTDVVKLETQGKKIWLGEGVSVRAHFSLAPLKSTHIMAAAYIVSKQAAAALVAQMQAVPAPFDHFLFNFEQPFAGNLTLCQLDPAIAIQAGLASTLQGERHRHDHDKRQKRTWMQTVQREILRIGRRSRTGWRGLRINLAGKEQWKRVAFDKTEDPGP